MTKATAASLLVMLSTLPAAAQDGQARSEAIDMASVMAAHDLCGFDLSDTQEDTLAKRRQALVDSGALTDGEIAAIDHEIAAAMTRQVPEGLCKAGGAQARLYRRQLESLDGD